MPLISIITTTYRHQDFIAHTIESILSQTFTDRELLIGDDSPDDQTRDIIQSYFAKYPNKIKARHHNPNKGIINNMNFLLGQVSQDAEYIAFLEGDDLFTPDNLQKKIEIIKQYPGLGMIYNNLDFIDENGTIYHKNFLAKAPYYLKNQTLTVDEFIYYETFYGSYSSLFIKKSVLDTVKIKNPTNDPMFRVSDRDLFFRIVKDYSVYGIEESLTQYRRHGGNVSANNIALFHDLEIQIDEYRTSGLFSEKQYKIKKHFICIIKTVAYLDKGQKKEARGCLRQALTLSLFSLFIYKCGALCMMFLPTILNRKIITYMTKRTNT